MPGLADYRRLQASSPFQGLQKIGNCYRYRARRSEWYLAVPNVFRFPIWRAGSLASSPPKLPRCFLKWNLSTKWATNLASLNFIKFVTYSHSSLFYRIFAKLVIYWNFVVSKVKEKDLPLITTRRLVHFATYVKFLAYFWNFDAVEWTYEDDADK